MTTASLVSGMEKGQSAAKKTMSRATCTIAPASTLRPAVTASPAVGRRLSAGNGR